MSLCDSDFPAGLLFWSGDSDYASLNPAMAFTLLLLKYAPMASSIDKSNRYRVGRIRADRVLPGDELTIRPLLKRKSTM